MAEHINAPLAAKVLQAEFVLVTDGSCCVNGYGGAAACLWHSGGSHTMVCARSGTSVARMEFDGLLMGMEKILALANGKPASVSWISDRETLVKTVSGEYKPRSDMDLWARYHVYAMTLAVIPFFSPRNTWPGQEYVDAVAGSCRGLVLGVREMLEQTVQLN